jgi:hypothetical protein
MPDLSRRGKSSHIFAASKGENPSWPDPFRLAAPEIAAFRGIDPFPYNPYRDRLSKSG